MLHINRLPGPALVRNVHRKRLQDACAVGKLDRTPLRVALHAFYRAGMRRNPPGDGHWWRGSRAASGIHAENCRPRRVHGECSDQRLSHDRRVEGACAQHAAYLDELSREYRPSRYAPRGATALRGLKLNKPPRKSPAAPARSRRIWRRETAPRPDLLFP